MLPLNYKMFIYTYRGKLMKTIRKVEIENFKSFEGKTEITFSPKLNIIVGLNGSGKTNLLEIR